MKKTFFLIALLVQGCSISIHTTPEETETDKLLHERMTVCGLGIKKDSNGIVKPILVEMIEQGRFGEDGVKMMKQYQECINNY